MQAGPRESVRPAHHVRLALTAPHGACSRPCASENTSARTHTPTPTDTHASTCPRSRPRRTGPSAACPLSRTETKAMARASVRQGWACAASPRPGYGAGPVLLHRALQATPCAHPWLPVNTIHSSSPQPEVGEHPGQGAAWPSGGPGPGGTVSPVHLDPALRPPSPEPSDHPRPGVPLGVRQTERSSRPASGHT